MKCLQCGAVFAPCKTCQKAITYYGWRKDYCTIECFQNSMRDGEKMFIKKVNDIPIRGKFRGQLYDENKMSDIYDYKFDIIKGEFKDNYGIERNIYDYQYLYITNDILEDILKEVYENGINEGFQRAKKEIRKNKRNFKSE